MKPEYILLICAGSVFVLLVLIYMIYAIEKSKSERRNKENIIKSYMPENLQKMEYDVAFYDKNVFRYGYGKDTERQVTIDDILSEETDNMTQLTEDAVFAHVEDKGVQQIKGNYNSANWNTKAAR